MDKENSFYKFLIQDLNSRNKKSYKVHDLADGKNNEVWDSETYSTDGVREIRP